MAAEAPTTGTNAIFVTAWTTASYTSTTVCQDYRVLHAGQDDKVALPFSIVTNHHNDGNFLSAYLAINCYGDVSIIHLI